VEVVYYGTYYERNDYHDIQDEEKMIKLRSGE